jgi:hypothetical protein
MAVQCLLSAFIFKRKKTELTPKVSCPSATVTLLLLALGPSVNNPPGPGLGPKLGLGRRVLGMGSGDEGSASDMDVGVAV